VALGSNIASLLQPLNGRGVRVHWWSRTRVGLGVFWGLCHQQQFRGVILNVSHFSFFDGGMGSNQLLRPNGCFARSFTTLGEIGGDSVEKLFFSPPSESKCIPLRLSQL